VAAVVLASCMLGTLPTLWLACSARSVPAKSAAVTTVAPMSTASAPKTPLEPAFHSTLRPFVKTYCVECHGGAKPKADLDLSAYATLATITRDVPRWDQVLERVKAAEMPPDDAEKQPPAKERAAVVAWLESMHAAEVQRT